jgi:hypothetical protein
VFLYLFICTHLQQWQNAEQAEEHKERQRQRERETVLGTILHISNNEGSREAHKPTLNHHRDSEPGHNTATGSSGGAGNDAGGERNCHDHSPLTDQDGKRCPDMTQGKEGRREG